MFIDPRKTQNQHRSEERKGAGVAKLYLSSAPPNGVGSVSFFDL
jgi:hypothetical protein